jgi:DNA mismatch repair protein MutS2
MARASEQVRKQLESLLGSLAKKGVLQEHFITERSGRWVIPVKDSHRHLVKGVLHDKSASGATAFIEPLNTLETNNRIRRLEAEERHEVEKVLRLLTGAIRQELFTLGQNFEILVSLDCVLAMALCSKALDQHAPALSARGVLRIKNGRHPLLALKETPATEVVPLDLSTGEGFSTLVITGPNTGGKTVALKTVGLLALMVSCGLHIPADADSTMPIFNRVFAHVGDAQSIEMDLSTFSAHVSDIKNVVENGSHGDLVLIDEIGSGTDPQEGAALAMAVLEVLTDRGVMTIVTTHHGALKAFAHQTPGVANGSMAFDGQTLAPSYRFRPDLPGSSYALEIAKRIGLPETVVSRSRSLMGSQANRLEELVLELEQQMDRNSEQKKDLEEEMMIATELRQQCEAQNARLKEETKTLRRKAAKEASAIVEQANAVVERAIRTIREKGASREGIREAKAVVREEKETLEEELASLEDDGELEREDPLAGVFPPGSQVSWKRSHSVGTVLGHEDQAGRVLVAFGKLKAHVPREELRGAKDEEASSEHRVSSLKVFPAKNVQAEIDIRGMRVEEALGVVDKFLDDALLADLKEVRIIHGVGTGALRNNLVPFLDEHPLVVEASPGGPGQGNPGVTIVKVTGD